MRRLFIYFTVALLIGKATAADPSAICDTAARQVSVATGVPLDVLLAITRTETGRRQDGRLQPWPWTVNMEGAGRWFDARTDAESFVAKHHARGARSYDVGCFQINYRWHGHAFGSFSEMFDPLANARYAARFLGELYSEFGDWSRAAGAFHSRTPRLSRKYAARFDAIRTSLQPKPAPVVIAEATRARRENHFPFLTGVGAARSAGSLVLLSEDSLPLYAPAQPFFGGS